MGTEQQTPPGPLAACLAAALLAPFAAVGQEAGLGPKRDLFRIDEVRVVGTKKVEAEAILEKVSSKAGMVLDDHLLKRDIEAIYALRHFEEVEAHHEREGGRDVLVFKVKEKPIVSKIVFEGNNEVGTDELEEKIKTKEFSILDVNTIKSDVKEMLALYEEKGFYLAHVGYDLKAVDEENVDLVFTIDEFDKVRVKKIAFLGNRAFGDDELKGIMETREEGLFSFMSGAGNFQEFSFQTDIERIKYFYKTKGFLQINVATPEITVSEDRRWVFITIRLQEGPEFSVRDISFQGSDLFPESELREKIRLRPDSIYSEETLRLDIQTLTELYQDEGYAFANVLRTLYVVPGEHRVDVEFSFEKGLIAHFGKVTIRGNTKTRDKVIRRELKIREGERYSGTALRESRENVNRLGFFERDSVVFNTVTRRGQDDVLDIEISVKERNTGQISLGAGYSTATSYFLQSSISENNFRGLGQSLSFSLSMSDVNQSINLGFTEPYFNDTRWTAGGDIFRILDTSSTAFHYKQEGFNIRVGHPILEYTRLFITYKFEDTELEDVEDPTVEQELENGLASSLRTAVIRDRRNNAFEPTGGHYLSFATEYAGLGGDKRWWLNEADGRYYRTLVGDLVFRSRLYASRLSRVDGRRIPRTERFSLGGARNLRGYEYEAVGPRQTVVDRQGRARSFNEGSLFSAFAQVELEHPLAREAGLKWVVFADAGDADEPDSFKAHADYGFGFRWFSPIGVLRFEFAYPMDDEAGRGSQFHFDIGQLF